MDYSDFLLQGHAGDGIVNALLYWFGIIQINRQLLSLN